MLVRALNQKNKGFFHTLESEISFSLIECCLAEEKSRVNEVNEYFSAAKQHEMKEKLFSDELGVETTRFSYVITLV